MADEPQQRHQQSQQPQSQEPSSPRFGNIHGSSFSIGGTNVTNTVHNTTTTGGPERRPTPAELLEAVQDLQVALVRLPRGADRAELGGELDGIAEALEGLVGPVGPVGPEGSTGPAGPAGSAGPAGPAEAQEVPQGLVGRLRRALERWAPLVEGVSAAAALGSLLTNLGG
ncbi:hypothetical protein [Streptomyces bambusae]|uniref:Uncharacterized protein n=1 Tax=Streptomyces bambusae TaxID=1550616 RepID=A0ABS6ZF55_9ACTN|nr:hypothetical protein [Streptomyces bambusae]MBW5486404.1 hypothetical protein [Streptomyces bambusae]